MATLTVQTISVGGLSPVYSAADAGGDKLKPGRTTFLHVVNGDASPITVTIATPGTTKYGLAIEDRAVTVGASDEQMIPIDPEQYGDPADSGLASVSYSSVTSVTVAALRI